MDESQVHPLLRLIRDRASVETFDTERNLDDAAICALVEDAIHAPSSFNIQHWRFVAVRRPEDKQRLKEAAYGQSQVVDAAVTFIILGDVRGVEKLPQIVEQAVQQGALPEGKGAAWLKMTSRIYSDPEMARDEAMRSGCLAAMTMMLAAEARGLASGALSGFDVERVKKEFEIDDRYVPVMLLAVGFPAGDVPPRQPRMPVDEVLSFDRCRLF